MNVTDTPKMISFHVPEDPAILMMLGTISVLHSHLDHVLRMTVKTITGLEIQEALDATELTGTAELRRRIIKLARQTLGEGEPLLKLQALLTRCRRVTSRRNDLIHSLYAKELDGDPVVRNSGREWLPLPTVEQLDEIASELRRLVQELNGARFEGGFLFDALQLRK